MASVSIYSPAHAQLLDYQYDLKPSQPTPASTPSTAPTPSSTSSSPPPKIIIPTTPKTAAPNAAENVKPKTASETSARPSAQPSQQTNATTKSPPSTPPAAIASSKAEEAHSGPAPLPSEAASSAPSNLQIPHASSPQKIPPSPSQSLLPSEADLAPPTLFPNSYIWAFVSAGAILFLAVVAVARRRRKAGAKEESEETYLPESSATEYRTRTLQSLSTAEIDHTIKTLLTQKKQDTETLEKHAPPLSNQLTSPFDAAVEITPNAILQVQLEPLRLSRTLLNLEFHYSLTLTNISEWQSQEVTLYGDLITAHSNHSYETLIKPCTTPPPLPHSIPCLEAGESINLKGALSLPIAEIKPIRDNQFVPLARYQVAQSSEPDTHPLPTHIFILGQPSDRNKDALRPLILGNIWGGTPSLSSRNITPS